MLPAAALILAAQELARASSVDAKRRGLGELLRAAGQVAEGDEPSPLEPLGALLVPAAAAVELDGLRALPAADARVARGLFELAHALPRGAARETALADVERRMFDGPAAVFVAVARQKALSAPHELRGDRVRARLGLALAGHASLDVGEAKLALALCSRRDGAHTWLELPSVRSLSERRMSARLLGRVARGLASTRAPLASLNHGREVEIVLGRLLGDREPLVWRHAAVARGLLAEVHPAARRDIDAALSPRGTTTDWRRGAASLAASFGHDPAWSAARLERLIADDLLRRDASVATAFTWGIAAGAERDPAGADRALSRVAELAPLAVAEGLVSALSLGPGGDFGRDAATRVRRELVAARDAAGPAAPGVGALLSGLLDELGSEPSSVVVAVARAATLYRERGATAAHEAAAGALKHLVERRAVTALLGDDADLEHDASLVALRELERGVLEDGTLLDLLSLGAGSARATQLEALDGLLTRATTAVLSREARRVARGAAPTEELPSRVQEVKTLLHLADVRAIEEPTAAAGTGERARRIAGATLAWLGRDPPSTLARALGATFARATGSLLRTGAIGVDDVLLACAWARLSARDVTAIAEASMSPDVEAALRGLIALSRAEVDDAPETRRHPSLVDARAPVPPEVGALSELAMLLDTGRPPHLRGVLSRGASALATVARAAAWGDLAAADEPSAVAVLERTVFELARRADDARRRFADGTPASLPPSAALGAGAFDDAVARGDHGDARSAARALAVTARALPEPFAELFARALERVATLPAGPATQRSPAGALPAWLPADRIVGGFAVEAPLGEGGTGTVFVVARVSERGDPSAERFAMKIPLLPDGLVDPSTLFRDEARALIDLPTHPNLARFVTFDLAAKPRPVLVMELVRGPSLEDELTPERMTVARAVSLVSGVAAGVAAMHDAGLAHLDLKPSNVIVRDGARAVLVDYGLSGRRLRPSCATAAYGAPEIWTAELDASISPLPADVYALACLAFEVLTGQAVFTGGEMAVLAAHLAHDGAPPQLAALARRHAPLASLLSSALRRDPAARVSARALGQGLDALAPTLTGGAWPLAL